VNRVKANASRAVSQVVLPFPQKSAEVVPINGPMKGRGGLKAPTITKIEEIATVIGVHPLSLLAFAYLPSNPADRTELCSRIKAEIESFETIAVRDGER